MRFRNPLKRLRDTKQAAKAAYIGGFLLLATGGTGAVAMVLLSWRVVDAVSPRAAEFLEPAFILAGIIAALGGISVMFAGWLLTRHRGAGKALLLLGSGVGLLTFLAHVAAVAIAGEDPAMDLLQSATTAQGMAVLVVLYARLRA